MVKTLYLILFLVLTLLNTAIAQEIEFTESEKKWIAEHPVIYHGYDASWHPFEFYNEKDSVYYGIIGDYIKIVEDKTGITIKPLRPISWEETIKEVKAGEIDLVTGIVSSESRQEYLSFSNSYLSYPLVIITRKEYDFIGGLEDLKGKKIAEPVSYYSLERISIDYPEIDIVSVKNTDEALQKVSFGHVDAFVGNLAVASYYINKEGYTNLKIAAPTKYDHIDVSFGVRKDWPELISVTNKIFSQIPQEKHNEIKNHWIKVRYEYGISIQQIIWGSAFALGIVLLVIAVILLWNRSLQKEIVKRNYIEKKLEESLLALEKKNEEKRAMLKEIHHRVKNNLQVVNSLLKLQSRKLIDVDAIDMFKETRNRVISMALLHEKMYRSDDIHQINVQEYISLLVEDLVKSYAVDKQIKLNIKIEPVNLMMRTLVPLGLIINEMITNSLKHGFKERTDGEIFVFIKQIGGVQYEMIIGDNGVGVKNNSKTTGIGVKLIKIFTKQLNGSLERLDKPGTVFRLVFEKIDLK